MKLTVLTDNTTRIDAYFLGEPGVSYYLEEGETRVLFDTGYSDVYLRNAEKLGIDLTKLTAIVFSHGHNDHTRGIIYFPETERPVTICAHPGVLEPKRCDGLMIGMPLSREELARRFTLQLSRRPVQLSERLTYLGEIPRTVAFEGKEPIGERFDGVSWQPDDLADDSALVYRGEEGLWIITGCSHAGICNIIDYAKKVCGEDRIGGVIGGFHLLEMTSRVKKTADYLKKENPKHLCPCHCTSFHARAAIHARIPVEEVCVGDTLELR